jgi:hypothetical protein
MVGEKNAAKRPEVREKISVALKGRLHPWARGKPLSPETRRKVSIALTGHSCSEETRKKISESKKGKPKPWMAERNKQWNPILYKGENNPCWAGGISFEPYCPKFNNEFRERVRAFFNYTCLQCGTPQNGSKLGVHHVHYNKETCCDGSTPLFIPLCKSCHGKTNGKKNRAQLEQYFTKLINTWYGGKCYLTREEMTAITS